MNTYKKKITALRTSHFALRTLHFALCTIFLTSCTERQVRIHFENAAQHRAHGHIDSAMAEYRAILKLNPNTADAANALGSLYSEKSDYQQAVTHYHQALINSDKANIYYNLGLAYTALGLADSAMAAHKNVIERDPKNSEAHNALGTVYASQGHIDEALTSYRKAIKHDPKNANAYLNIGLVYAAQGNFRDAIQHYRNAIQYSPTFVGAHNNLGSVYAEQGLYDLAIQHFEQALKLAPNYTLARDNLNHAKSLKQRLEDGEMRARHILVDTEAEAQNVLQKLKAGATFESLARLHSRDPSGQTGGDLGGFMTGDLMPQFEQAVKNIAPGNIDGPVKTAAGYHIIERIY